MTQDVHIGILCGANKPLGRLRLGLAEALVDARNHHVQLGQHLIREIEPSVFQNVHFRAGKQSEISSLLCELLIDFLDFLKLLTQARFIETIRLEGRL